MSMESMLTECQKWVGYIEKASNANLYSFTANAGQNNYTLFGKWFGLNGQPWCDVFISYCAYKVAEGEAVGKFAYCPSHVQYFKQLGRWYKAGIKPQAGDIIFFSTDGSTAEHVGIVEYTTESGVVHTIEGNTSNKSTLVTNGGEVARKSYRYTSTYILGYGRPKYREVVKEEPEDMTQEQFNKMLWNYYKTLYDNDAGEWSKDARQWAIDNGIIAGVGDNNYAWEFPISREQAVTILYRALNGDKK